MWQETAIIIIGILTAGYAGWKIVRFFKPSRKEVPFCAGCRSHCPLKELKGMEMPGKRAGENVVN